MVSLTVFMRVCAVCSTVKSLICVRLLWQGIDLLAEYLKYEIVIICQLTALSGCSQ